MIIKILMLLLILLLLFLFIFVYVRTFNKLLISKDIREINVQKRRKRNVEEEDRRKRTLIKIRKTMTKKRKPIKRTVMKRKWKWMKKTLVRK